MTFRSERYPILAGYLQRLPSGIDSYPRCQAKCSLLKAVLAECSSGGDTDGLHEELRVLLEDPPPPSTWIPEVHSVAAHFALMDIYGIDDDAMLRITYTSNRKLAESRMYRALAKVSSPGMLVKGASMSWGFIHKGSTLRTETLPEGVMMTLRHPAHVYTNLGHRSVARGFTAALEASNAENPKVDLLLSTHEEAKLRVSWD